MECFYHNQEQNSVFIEIMSKTQYDEFIDNTLDTKANWLLTSNRKVSSGNFYLIPNAEGVLNQVLVISDDQISMWSIANLPWSLPPGNYHLSDALPQDIRRKLSLGWGLGAYRYTKYLEKSDECARLYITDDIELTALQNEIEATNTVRNLINTPANEMMPTHLSDEAKSIAEIHGANYSEIVGDDLLTQNYPLIHSVGRASKYEPRLLKLEWGDSSQPLLSIVGKGVCFDSGGLNIKSGAGMRWMKKDMGGAAHVLGLARFIMQRRLPVHLHVYIPTVENAISGDAYRPGDVIKARNGKTVEIDNTDAEGRLILADALVEACENKPDLLIDFATLTGAARVALGTEVAVFYSTQDSTAHDLYKSAKYVEDDIWRLPLHPGYKHQLKSNIANLVNCASGPYGGSITAALFLQSFVNNDCDWLHFDMMAYNMRTRPGRPKGGEAMGLRSICDYLEKRYSS